MKKLIIAVFVLSLASCAASNYGDPTRPDIRNQAKKTQRENLKYYGND